MYVGRGDRDSECPNQLYTLHAVLADHWFASIIEIERIHLIIARTARRGHGNRYRPLRALDHRSMTFDFMKLYEKSYNKRNLCVL